MATLMKHPDNGQHYAYTAYEIEQLKLNGWREATTDEGYINDQAINIVTIQNVAIGATSAQSSAVNASTKRIVMSASSACWVALGSDPTAAAHDGAFYLPADGQSYPFSVVPGVTKIAVIQDSADGYLSIIESM